MNVCTCGAENQTGARFCRACGSRIGSGPVKAAVEGDTLRPMPPTVRTGASANHLADGFETPRSGRGLLIAAVSGLALLLVAGVTAAVVLATRDSSAATERVRPAVTSTSRPPAASSTSATTTPSPSLPPIPLEAQGTVDLAQRWASALAAHDWPAARSLQPSIAATSDDELQKGFGGLNEDRIVFVGTRGAGAVMVASVAHENVGAGPRTNVYCYLVEADTVSATLRATYERRVTEASIPGTVETSWLIAEINQCQTA